MIKICDTGTWMEKSMEEQKANPETDLCITHLANDKDDYFKSVGKGKSTDSIVTMGYPFSKKIKMAPCLTFHM